MKMLPLLPHEASAAAADTLRAIWRPVEPSDRTWTYSIVDDGEDGVFWLWDADECGEWQRVPCPYGQPGDVVVLRWSETKAYPMGGKTTGTVEYRRRIAAVDVRRVADMSEADAVDWGFTAYHESRIPTWAVFQAKGVCRENWPGKEWAWVIGLNEEKT